MRAAMLIAFVVLFAGCAAPPKPAPPSQPAPQPSTDRHGKVALEIIPDPAQHPPEFRPDEEFVMPKIVGDPLLPEYPPDALEGRAADSLVYVRMTIGSDGRVKSVEDCPHATSTPGPFADQFRASTARTLRRWRFSPGHVDRMEKDGEVTRVLSSTPVDVFFDLRVEFNIVDGKGVVKTAP